MTNSGLGVIGLVLTGIALIVAGSKVDEVKSFFKSQSGDTVPKSETPDASNDTTPKGETNPNDIPASDKQEKTNDILTKIEENNLNLKTTVIKDEEGKVLLDLGNTNISKNTQKILDESKDSVNIQKKANAFSSDEKNIKVDPSIIASKQFEGRSDTGNFIGDTIFKAGTGLSEAQLSKLSLNDLIKFGYAKTSSEASNFRATKTAEIKKLTAEGKFGTNTGKGEKNPTLNKGGETISLTSFPRVTSAKKEEEARKSQQLFNALYPTLRSNF